MEKLHNACLCLIIFGILLPCTESQETHVIMASTLTGSVAENSAAGTTVTTLATSGFTAGNVVVTLGAHSPAVAGSPWFELSVLDVVVKTGIIVNYEDAAFTSTPKDYTIVVTAVNSGAGESATATITITITDVINPTLNTGLVANLDENSPSGTLVTSVGPTAGGVAFISEAHDYLEIATLNAGNGKMTVKEGVTIDYEAADLMAGKTYEVTVVAVAHAHERTTATATITIVDIAEFDTATLTKDQSENAALQASITTVTSTTSGATFALTAEAPDHGMFVIDGTTGVVSLAANKNLDYENTDVVAASYKYELTLEVIHPDSSNPNTGTATLTITILDYPAFTSSLTANLQENSAADTEVLTIVTDPVGAVLEAGAQTGNLGWLSLDTSTRKVTVATGMTVDYEEASLTDHKYTMGIKATDDTDNTETSTVTLTITIQDVVELTPAFTAASVTADVAENAAAGDTVTTLAVENFSGTPVVTLGAHSPAVTGGPWFELTAMDVKVKAGAAVNYEDTALTATSKEYRIVVIAEDSAAAETASTTITLTITDVVAAVSTGLSANLDENIAAGFLVTTVGPLANGVTFTLGTISPNHDYFEIATAATGAVTVKSGANIDYEVLTPKEYEIEVVANEAGETSVTATATITIDDVPEFDTDTLTKSQSEMLAAGGSVTTVTTTTASSTFILVSQDPDQGKFTVSPAGVVNLAALTTLDYEDAALVAANYEYKLTIRATHPSNSNTGTATLTITILDYPAFTSSLTANLPENSTAGTEVFTIVTDPVGAVLEAGAQTGNLGWLSLDTSTRKVTVAASINMKYDDTSLIDHKYTMEITASNSGRTASATLTVTIEEVTENGTDVLTGSVMATVLLLMASMLSQTI